MFTLKFMRNNPSSRIISCPHFEVRPNELTSGVTVEVFPGFTLDGGTEYVVMPDAPGDTSGQGEFTVCYVENSAGKTIHKIGPY